MDQDAIRQKIRERLAAGTLPREVPPLTGGPGQPLAPRAHIKADTAIGLARCSGCDDQGRSEEHTSELQSRQSRMPSSA